MRHLRNLINNTFAGCIWMLPGIIPGSFIIGLVWGACWVLDKYGY